MKVAIAAILAAGFVSAGAHAQPTSVFRYESSTYGQSSESSTTTVYDIASGNTTYQTNGSTYFDSAGQYTTVADSIAQFSGPFSQRGLNGTISNSGTWSGFAQTGAGYNKVGASLSGAVTANQSFDAQNPLAGFGIRLDTQAYRYSNSSSRYDEIFLMTQAGQAGGTGNFTVNLSVTGSLTESGYFNFNVAQFDSNSFQTQVYGLSSSDVYDATLGGLQSFARPLSATFAYEYNVPTLLTFYLTTSVSDNGEVDLTHTARVTSVDVPNGTAVYFQSGAGGGAYGDIVGGAYGQFGGGGGGGGPPPIPEPHTYAMLLAGLALIGSMAMRRRMRG